MARSSQETKLSKEIRDALTKLGVMHERVQCGRIPMRHGGFLWLASNGTPDTWTKWGWIEVKDLTDLSPEQRAWHAKAKQHNVRVAVAHSVQEALQTIEGWKKEEHDMANQIQENVSEISNAAKRLSLARYRLTQSAEWAEYADAVTLFNFAIGNETPKLDLEVIDGGPVTIESIVSPAPVDTDDEFEVGPASGDREPVSQPYDDDTIDGIVRRALSGIDDVESALTVGKIAKDCELDTALVGKSLKRIGALNNGGVKRGVRYYLPVAPNETATEE